MGLVKATNHGLKKLTNAIATNGDCSSAGNIKLLDDVGERVGDLSEIVDDFVLTLYSPVERDEVMNTVCDVMTSSV